jgi:hypothetical protein
MFVLIIIIIIIIIIILRSCLGYRMGKKFMKEKRKEVRNFYKLRKREDIRFRSKLDYKILDFFGLGKWCYVICECMN